MKKYEDRLVELDEIIKNLPKNEFDAIPKEIIRIIRDNKNPNYVWKYVKGKSLQEQNLHRDTIILLSFINTEFILKNDQKDLMEKIHKFNDITLK